MIQPECISAYVVRKTDKGPLYLLLRRCSPYLNGTWQMISGSIEHGETAMQAAAREIKEETGMDIQEIHSADAVETFYMPSKDRVMFVPVFFAFVESDEVRLSSSEHDAFAWLSFHDAQKRLIFSEQKKAIQIVHELGLHG